MSNQTDPLAGIATATASPAKPRAPKVTPPVTPAASTGVIVLDERRARRQAYKNARDTARAATGYNDTSPIWGRQMPEVLVDIEKYLVDTITAINNGDYADATVFTDEALILNRELQKRLATNKLTGAQLRP